MPITKKASSIKKAKILELLNTTLEVEYSFIVHYPRLASSIPDQKIRKLVKSLGEVSVEHANIVADAVSGLGGKLHWGFEPFPEEISLTEIFHRQIDKEKEALRLHTLCGRLTEDPELKRNFEKNAVEEEGHIKIIRKIMERMSALGIR
ncbi:MAG: ferritin-like domain-containing protein [Candidatus Aminicenantes bacterium]|nr:ferritin-like domain-containing protein [Candidatus Aminicenantes bacterium]